MSTASYTLLISILINTLICPFSYALPGDTKDSSSGNNGAYYPVNDTNRTHLFGAGSVQPKKLQVVPLGVLSTENECGQVLAQNLEDQAASCDSDAEESDTSPLVAAADGFIHNVDGMAYVAYNVVFRFGPTAEKGLAAVNRLLTNPAELTCVASDMNQKTFALARHGIETGKWGEVVKAGVNTYFFGVALEGGAAAGRGAVEGLEGLLERAAPAGDVGLQVGAILNQIGQGARAVVATYEPVAVFPAAISTTGEVAGALNGMVMDVDYGGVPGSQPSPKQPATLDDIHKELKRIRASAAETANYSRTTMVFVCCASALYAIHSTLEALGSLMARFASQSKRPKE